MIRSTHLLASLAFAPLAVAACSGSSAAPSGGPATPGDTTEAARSNLARDTAPSVPPADADALALGNTAFAFDLYRSVTGQDATTNFFYSPYSVSIALAMTYAGAGGATATQLASALHFTLPPERLHPAFNALDLALASRAAGAGKGFHLDVADSLWAERTLSFGKPFLDTLGVNYGAGVFLTDFLGAPEGARADINGWVSDHTSAKIPELLPEHSLTSDTRFVLVNAIYFDAAWATPFDERMTQPAAFHRLDGSAAQPATMSNYYESAPWASGDGWQAVELGYDGDQTSMLVIVPDAGKFAAVESALDATFYAGVTAALAPKSVALALPKFTIPGATFSLRQQLLALGAADAFDAEKADFFAMIDQQQGPTWIGDVLHQAFVRVDEKGTEAAAATAVIGVGTSAAVDVKDVTVDRPFFFAIRDVPTGTVLFLGRVTDPG